MDCIINKRSIQYDSKNIKIVGKQIEFRDSESLLRYCKGQCTPAEEKAIEAELAASNELREHLHQLRLSLAIADDIELMEDVDVEAGYLRTQGIIKRNRANHFKVNVMRYAAMLSLPLLLSSFILGYLYWSQPMDEVVQYAEVTTPSGTVIRYELPDGSVVWLNAGTRLRYPVKFYADKREVELNGEAYFDVQANAESPFYVHTKSGMSVYVYGTRFNVNAYSDETSIETTLEEGKVNVIVPDLKGQVKLEPGERFSYDKATHQLQKSQVDVDEKTAWKDGKLIFRNAALPDVLKRLSRHFNVDIELQNKSGKEYRYRATFKDETLLQILDYLSKTAEMKWEQVQSVQKKDETFTKNKIIVTI